MKKHGEHGTQVTAEDVTIPGTVIGNTAGNDSEGVEAYNVQYSYGLFGIYDKSGRWSVNGGNTENHLHPVGSIIKSSTNLWNVQGGLYWGDNIGWNMDTGRKVAPIRNSLHPTVPYSTLYMGCNVYQGYNRDDWHETATNVDSLANSIFLSGNPVFKKISKK